MEVEKVANENLLDNRVYKYVYIYTYNLTWWKNNWNGDSPVCLPES